MLHWSVLFRCNVKLWSASLLLLLSLIQVLVFCFFSNLKRITHACGCFFNPSFVKAFKCDEYNCYIIKCLPQERILQDVLNTSSDLLMNTCRFWIVQWVPNTFDEIYITNFIKNSIRCDSNEIMVWSNLKTFDLRNCYDYIRISSELFNFCFYVSKGSWDT